MSTIEPILGDAQFEHLYQDLKEVLKEMQRAVDFYSEKGNQKMLDRMSNQMLRIAKFASYSKQLLEQRKQPLHITENLSNDYHSHPKFQTWINKEAYRQQTIQKLEKEMPHLFNFRQPLKAQ
ncbi:MAG: hypothetical protein MK212_17800 [Saprospiraceae bacterium]|nr:hypothetical protein [Saprospiraceae bacterium]